jgi:hypothetical protein
MEFLGFLEALRDPMHEEHIAMRRWCGGGVDPAGFDVNDVNTAIRRLAHLRPSR